MKIVAFGASQSRTSINKQLATFAALRFEGADVKILDLNDYDMPVFTPEREEKGHPERALQFVKDFKGADLIIISFAEYNGSYSTGFKNIFDWASRVELRMFEGSKLFLMATATGAGGGRYVLEAAKTRFPKHGGEIIADFYLPFFFDNFSPETGITHSEYKSQFMRAISQVEENLVRS